MHHPHSKQHRLRVRCRHWLRARVRRVAQAVVSRRLAVAFLIAVLAVEMTVLGVGLSRRMEMLIRHATEMSEAELARIEAESLFEGTRRGILDIYASQSGSGDMPTDNPDDPDAPPPLRPRDVMTILATEDVGTPDDDSTEDIDLTDEDDPNAAAVTREPTGDVTTGEMTQEQTDAAVQEALDTPAPTPLSPAQRVQTDELIRRAVTAMTAGDMRECVLNLEKAHDISPDHPAMLYYYGLAYDKLLNPDKAREYYTQVFRMRSNAGKYFQRAAHRLSFGFSRPSDMRGKLSFGPHQVNHTYDDETGEQVDLLLPILLAPGEELNLSDIYIRVRFFMLVNGRKIEFAPDENIKWLWQNETPTWKDSEENLMATFVMPPLTQEEINAYGDMKYYGFTAKIFYKGEPLDCISSPSALILQEQLLNSRSRRTRSSYNNGLLPDDGLDSSYEEALPVSDFLESLR